jgi:hypothetical protein
MAPVNGNFDFLYRRFAKGQNDKLLILLGVLNIYKNTPFGRLLASSKEFAEWSASTPSCYP